MKEASQHPEGVLAGFLRVQGRAPLSLAPGTSCGRARVLAWICPRAGDTAERRGGRRGSAALRPALPHNRPEIRFDGTVLTLNGLFRHGYLLAPALGAAATALLSGQPVHAEARPFVEEVPCAS